MASLSHSHCGNIIFYEKEVFIQNFFNAYTASDLLAFTA